MNPKVNPFFMNLKKWREELEVLRELVLQHDLEEAIKWNHPCYMYEGKNVLMIVGFKEYFGISFFKGVLLEDASGMLYQQGQVQAGRLLRFNSMDELLDKEEQIRGFISQAVELEKSGAKVEMKKASDFKFPVELLDVFAKDDKLKSAFAALTPGRQKDYCRMIGDAKNTQTRYNRIEKYSARILRGKGLNDCICGLSKRMPSCDGSHKFAKGH